MDWIYLKGIHTLKISHGNKGTITDKAFIHLKGIHTLNMAGMFIKKQLQINHLFI